MFGYLKHTKDKGPEPLARLTEAELSNVLEQERIVNDAIRIHLMLSSALNTTMRVLAEKYELPKLFELDKTTGKIFKESSNG